MEYSCNSPDEQRWFIGKVTLFVVHNLRRILIEHTNITERKLAEDELRVARQTAEEQALHYEFQHSLMRAIIDASLDGILVIDDLNNVVSHNQKFADIWDIPLGCI